MLPRVLPLVAMFAALSLGCDTDVFEPPDQGPCEITSDCPVGYVCEGERCILEENATGDAGADAGTDTTSGSGDGSSEGSGDGSGMPPG